MSGRRVKRAQPDAARKPVRITRETLAAGIFELERPRVAIGAPANVVLLDLRASWRVHAANLRSRSTNSWLLDQRLTGRVRMTIAAGCARLCPNRVPISVDAWPSA